MRKLILTVLIFLIIGLFCFSWNGYEAFLEEAIDVGAGVKKINGTDFTSKEIILIGKGANISGLTLVFTRAAGSALTIDFAFEVSTDGGITWATYGDNDGFIEIPTNEAPVEGNTVRIYWQVYLFGASNIRLKSIHNSDGANNVTAVNVCFSY